MLLRVTQHWTLGNDNEFRQNSNFHETVNQWNDGCKSRTKALYLKFRRKIKGEKYTVAAPVRLFSMQIYNDIFLKGLWVAKWLESRVDGSMPNTTKLLVKICEGRARKNCGSKGSMVICMYYGCRYLEDLPPLHVHAKIVEVTVVWWSHLLEDPDTITEEASVILPRS